MARAKKNKGKKVVGRFELEPLDVGVLMGFVECASKTELIVMLRLIEMRLFGAMADRV